MFNAPWDWSRIMNPPIEAAYDFEEVPYHVWTDKDMKDDYVMIDGVSQRHNIHDLPGLPTYSVPLAFITHLHYGTTLVTDTDFKEVVQCYCGRRAKHFTRCNYCHLFRCSKCTTQFQKGICEICFDNADLIIHKEKDIVD